MSASPRPCRTACEAKLSSAKTKPAPKSRPVEFALAPVDNPLLANLCGPLDENIRQIETGFDVLIRRRNERISITGEKAQLTADAIRHFYAMAREPLSVDEIQLGLIAFLNAPVRRISRSAEGPLDGPQLVTRKTYLAVASAVDAFERDLVERIILTRPAVEAGERLGFLPGDLTQKIDPYLRPLYDALYDL